MSPRPPDDELRPPLPPEGVSVPLLASFAGLARRLLQPPASSAPASPA